MKDDNELRDAIIAATGTDKVDLSSTTRMSMLVSLVSVCAGRVAQSRGGHWVPSMAALKVMFLFIQADFLQAI